MKPLARAAVAAILAIALGSPLLAAAGGPVLATQKNRAFQPGNIDLVLGEVLRILNDDGPLLHHAFVQSDAFNFDSGEQQPGGSVDLNFPVRGSYTVLCGIHPKMRLVVTVR